ncbi:MAG: hypothetical protein NDI60_09445 [Elusimicrobiales bacterium]|nr:hypothetical protein [Elusimicrobiales bacterium]
MAYFIRCLALLAFLAPLALAQDYEEEETSRETTTEAVQEEQDASEPAREDVPEPKAGISSGEKIAPPKGGGAAKGGGGSGSGAVPGAAAGAASQSAAAAGNLRVYNGWKSLPMVGGHARLKFSGDGTGFSVRFTPRGNSMVAWVETTNSTDNCNYKAWISAAPGGGAVPGKCGPVHSGYTGNSLTYTLEAVPSRHWECVLKKEQTYYFNIQLASSGPNPVNGIYSCEEYLDIMRGAMEP